MNPILLLVIIAICIVIYFVYKSEKAQGTINQTLFSRILAPIKEFFNDFYSNRGLIIDDIAEDHIVVNTMYKNLYGIKIESKSNIPVYLDDLGVDEIYRTYSNSKDSFFWYVVFKDKFYHKQYIFSYNKNIVKSIADKFKVSLLTGEELANSILDLFLQNHYYIQDKDIHRTISLNFNSALESNYQIFSKLARENIYQNLNHTDLYQSYKTLENVGKTNIQSLYKMDFDGAVWTYFDIGRQSIENHIARLINTAKWTGKKSHFLQLKEAYDNGEQKLVIVNSTAHFKRLDESILGNFGTALKVNFIKKDIFKTKSLQKTPLKFRDSEYDFLAPIDFLANYVSCVHKERTKNADFWGFDKNGSFINYSFADDNFNPHTFIVANTGAGKSFTMQKILTTMLDVDYKTAKANNLDKDKVIVRYYDIGFSNKKLIEFLKSNKDNSIAHVESDLAHFSYNIVNLDNTNEEVFEADLIFSADLISLILSSQHGTDTLTSSEIARYSSILRKIYNGEQEFQKYRVRDIRNKELRNKIINLGFSENEYLKELPSEFEFLKKPLLEDVIKMAKIEAENQQISEDLRADYASLAKKLKDVDDLGLFSNFDTEDTVNTNFLSMDLNNFKENSLFVPIFVSIFQKTYLKDRAYALKRKFESKSISKKIYVMEESANFFRVPYFCVLLEKLALEARKYGVHLILIAQQLSQIPQNMAEIVDTRILMTSPDKKREFIDSITRVLNPEESVVKMLETIERFELCVWYSKGVFSMKLPITSFEERLFNSDPNKIVA
ncbi:hypothetical protein [Campylobacter sp. CCUG 57310]|uniref:hypothetical protein n=1 Tax=Campylobacter sp. CCUG 57310 TaxID=2517362 RepID=UPI0015646E69|nr:hypothetical protein [Campylobacter sp. CCUG 57310]QKF93216.1 hypothetical protein CORI_a030 [Campylobacter sp. CCUG 57310]